MINKTILIVIKLSILWLMTSSFVKAKTITLNNRPIEIALPINKRVRIEFPETVLDFAHKPDAPFKVFNNPNGTIYITAKEFFNRQSALATTAKGKVIMLDLIAASNSLKAADYVLVEPSSKPKIKPPQPKQVTEPPKQQDPYELMPAFLKQKYNTTSNRSTNRQASYTQMAAFALQHYFGPSRLIEPIQAKRLRHKNTNLKRLVRVWGNRLKMRVLNRWKSGKYYITAVKVKNISNQPYFFDPRAIRAPFVFVASLNAEIPPIGSPQNETIWVLITDKK